MTARTVGAKEEDPAFGKYFVDNYMKISKALGYISPQDL